MKILPSVISSVVHFDSVKGAGSMGGSRDVILFPTSSGDKAIIFPGGSSKDDYIIDFPR